MKIQLLEKKTPKNKNKKQKKMDTVGLEFFFLPMVNVNTKFFKTPLNKMHLLYHCFAMFKNSGKHVQEIQLLNVHV